MFTCFAVKLSFRECISSSSSSYNSSSSSGGSSSSGPVRLDPKYFQSNSPSHQANLDLVALKPAQNNHHHSSNATSANRACLTTTTNTTRISKHLLQNAHLPAAQFNLQHQQHAHNMSMNTTLGNSNYAPMSQSASSTATASLAPSKSTPSLASAYFPTS
jgi:hypothetical protein